MRDVLLGALMYVLMIGNFIGVVVLCALFFGPPADDRSRSLAFFAGGGALVVFGCFLVAVSIVAASIKLRLPS